MAGLKARICWRAIKSHVGRFELPDGVPVYFDNICPDSWCLQKKASPTPTGFCFIHLNTNKNTAERSALTWKWRILYNSNERSAMFSLLTKGSTSAWCGHHLCEGRIPLCRETHGGWALGVAAVSAILHALTQGGQLEWKSQKSSNFREKRYYSWVEWRLLFFLIVPSPFFLRPPFNSQWIFDQTTTWTRNGCKQSGSQCRKRPLVSDTLMFV